MAEALKVVSLLHPKIGKRGFLDTMNVNLSLVPSATNNILTLRILFAYTFHSHPKSNGNTVFLRTHFSDNHPITHTNRYNYVRDYLKAAAATNSKTAAKSTLTRLLTLLIDANESSYCTFAITLASALSNTAENTCYERGDRSGTHDLNIMVNSDKDLDKVREEFCKLMHIVFSKLQKYHFMISEEGSNAYRLFHCKTATAPEKMPLVYACFSFLLQVCLTAYVILQLITNFQDDVYTWDRIRPNIPLAILTLLYSTVLAIPEFKETPNGFKIFGKVGVLQTMDFLVNAILPSVLIVTGFVVILGQEEFIDAVLNTAALLFIPEIDDQLPSLLGFSESAIVKNYLIAEAIKEFDALHDNDVSNDSILGNAKEEGMGVQFGDYFLTNWPEQSSDPEDGIIFQPFQVRKGKDERSGDHIDPSSYITEDCLIKKLTWRYTVYDNTSSPRIGYLKIEMLGTNYVMEVKRPEEERVKLGKEHTLEGVLVITTFQMSNDVLRLRVCGSKTASDFAKAFEYYNFWPCSKAARKRLKEAAKLEVGKFARTTKAHAQAPPDFDFDQKV